MSFTLGLTSEAGIGANEKSNWVGPSDAAGPSALGEGALDGDGPGPLDTTGPSMSESAFGSGEMGLEEWDGEWAIDGNGPGPEEGDGARSSGRARWRNRRKERERKSSLGLI
ncbi:ubiquitin carboxyl-terminal hydrolase 33 [Striga asiatica]|uniref:Ubiquitin carboxyl-terminal hydrolase 33 n=1 Tax=Striga asiatica TaxID=4170 RepID=A0A5A7NZD1_STRAF|nr:ubiquitin carboxyl-terminal hydrolase 33 [Striga asiatica]